MLGVIILNYNNAALTIQCLESVRKHNSYPSKYIIVDNASTDDSTEILRDYLSKSFTNNFREYPDRCKANSLAAVSLTTAGHNGGYAQGNNVGLQLAECDDDIDKILILNNDILFLEDIIPGLVSFLDKHPDAGIVSPLLLKKDGRDIDFNCARKDCSLKEIAYYYLLYCRDYKGILSGFADERKILLNNPSLLEAESVEIELPSGSCMLIDKDLFKSIGYFDPHTFLYYEEGILFRKLAAIGKTNYILPGLKCIHLGARTTSSAIRSYSYLKTSNKSAYYYVMHYRKLNIFQKIGFTLLFASYNCILFIRQHLKKR